MMNFKKIIYGIVGAFTLFFAVNGVSAATLTANDFAVAQASPDVLQASGITFNSTYNGYTLAEGEYTLSENVTAEIIVTAGEVSLNLGGTTLTGSLYTTSNAKLTVSGNGTVVGGVGVYGTSLVTINGGSYSYSLTTFGGKLTINDATVTTSDSDAIYVWNGGSLEVNGGTFTAVAANWQCGALTIENGTDGGMGEGVTPNNIVINGGTFSGVNGGINAWQYNSLTINGGTFRATGNNEALGVKAPVVLGGSDTNIFNTILGSGKSFSGTYEIKTKNVYSTDYVYVEGEEVTVGTSGGSSSTTSEKAVYETLEGANQTFSTNSSNTLTFRFNVDYSKFESNGKVYVDGSLVDPSNYSSKSGSTIIVFNQAYVKKLANGKHTMVVDFGDGTATTSFTITGNPDTSDHILNYFIALIFSIFGLVLVTTKKITNNM